MKRVKVKPHTGSDTFEIIELSNTLSLHMGRNLTREELSCLIEDPSFDVTIVAPDKVVNHGGSGGSGGGA